MKVLNYGAEVEQVVEQNFGFQAVVVFEFEEYPEPKLLSKKQLKHLYLRYNSYAKVSKHIGVSPDFVSQNIRGIK